MKIKIARIRKGYYNKISTEVVDTLVFKHDGKYYGLYSYGKLLSQKGRKFSSRRWILRNKISIRIFRENSLILGETQIDEINLSELMDILSYYKYYLENCSCYFEENLIENFDVVL